LPYIDEAQGVLLCSLSVGADFFLDVGQILSFSESTTWKQNTDVCTHTGSSPQHLFSSADSSTPQLQPQPIQQFNQSHARPIPPTTSVPVKPITSQQFSFMSNSAIQLPVTSMSQPFMQQLKPLQPVGLGALPLQVMNQEYFIGQETSPPAQRPLRQHPDVHGVSLDELEDVVRTLRGR
jgi:hypothetical protein